MKNRRERDDTWKPAAETRNKYQLAAPEVDELEPINIKDYLI